MDARSTDSSVVSGKNAVRSGDASPSSGAFRPHRAPAIQRAAKFVVTLAMLAAGCDDGLGARRDAGAEPSDGGRALDVPGLDAPEPVVAEICTNGIDEDRNGSVDDGCPCAVGTRRACWPGPPDMRTVGVCRDGEQACISDGATALFGTCTGAVIASRETRDDGLDNDCNGATDEEGAICRPRVQLEDICDDGQDDDCDTAIDCDDPDCAEASDCAGRCTTEELVCWGAQDDDCDGDTDCDDAECASDPSCTSELTCPPGQVTTYRERALDPTRGGSSIAAGDGAPPFSVDCEDGSCPEGQVRVIDASGASSCVPPPPSCPDGQHPSYAGYARWECTGPCEIIIHYGGIYGGLNVCAERPDLSCEDGQVPTFVYETQQWTCRPECNDTLYDRFVLDGELVCIPC